MLAILTAVKWIQANWRMVAVCAAMFSCAAVGYGVRGYLCTAEKNAAIAQAVKASEDKMRGDYEKATQLEKRKRAIREKARLANTDIYSAGGDACTDKPVSTDIMRLIERAYDNITG